MKAFFIDFLTLLANCILIVCLSLMSFFLIANLYHAREISYGYSADLKNDSKYKDYKKTINDSFNKMKNINYDNRKNELTAKPIYQYYSDCVESLNNGTFANFENDDNITALDIYNANNEILNDYNNKCIFYLPYSIETIYKDKKQNVSFNNVLSLVEERGNIISSNAKYLTDSELGNSSYTFTTDTSRVSIYNKIKGELDLTMNNYELISLILSDISDWYVLEFGGNN